MNKMVSLALIVVGVVLIVLGVLAMDSFSSDVSRFFTGTPTDKSVWMLIAGALSAIVGLSGVTVFRTRD
jgi:divalent metal cation (Fe/Co/Zn/Cd) transporter